MCCVCACLVCGGNLKRQDKAMTPGDNPSALSDKCHGLFYVPTGTEDRQLNVPSQRQLVVYQCSVGRWIE